MSFYGDQVLPRMLAFVMGGRAFEEQRRQALEGVTGRVLELGFGAGHNLAHYGPGVTEVLALEPAGVNHRLAAGRIASVPFPVKWVGLLGESIPLEDQTVDAVVSTWTLCTIGDVRTALEEVRRVLKPGGRLWFLEHGLSPDPRVARWQRHLNPFQRRCCGGCNLDRPIDRMIEMAGFKMEGLETYYARGPRAASWIFRGKAHPLNR